ncbi:hypothetical protein SCUCBS95973_001371 [Sporothrix curviconia]|uniref:Uncharacterized protein n=1 Tax=Sporothrix curviconia TaxID=1260050 RepID=A0ABP0AYC6_9PEZI
MLGSPAYEALPQDKPDAINLRRSFTDAGFKMYRDRPMSIICGHQDESMDTVWP